MTFPLLVTAFLVAADGRLPAQDRSPTPLARAAAFMKDYMRGATENRFDVGTTLVAYDSAGKILRTRKANCRLEYVKGRFKGAGMDGSEEGDWQSTIRVGHATRFVLGFEILDGVELLMQPAFVFGPNSQSKWSLDVSGGDESVPLRIAYEPTVPCSSFEAARDGFRPKTGFCGLGKITIDERGDMPLRVVVDGTGLPLALEKGALIGYHGESEFQYVSVSGAKQRLVFPKTTIGTFVFQDHKMVVRSSYEFHAGKW